jgi:hypothetical protein
MFAALAGAATSAHADSDPALDADGPDQLVMPKGKLAIDAYFEIGMTKDNAGKPVSLAPDLWYGLSDELSIGLVHSLVGTAGLMGGQGDSLCLSSTSSGCAHVYNNGDLDLRYGLAKGNVAFALQGGLFLRDTDPFEMGVNVGALFRAHSGGLALEIDPQFFFGFTHRDDGNKDELTIPVTGMVNIVPALALLAQIGFDIPLENTGDFWAMSIAFGLRYRLTGQIHLDAAWTFNLVTGGNGYTDKGADVRTLTLGGGYAF